MSASRYFVFIPAAGIGVRVGSCIPKQYMPLFGQPMLMHILKTFIEITIISHIFVVVRPTDEYIADLLSAAPQLHRKVTVLFHGGSSRRESVLNGLKMAREQINDEDWILVHDAARPGLTCTLTEHLIHTLCTDPVGGLLALPVVDTLKTCDTHMRTIQTIPNSRLWMAQTPQMFRYKLLLHALEISNSATDEANAVEQLGLKPRLVEGSLYNLKVTLPNDLALVENFLRERHLNQLHLEEISHEPKI